MILNFAKTKPDVYLLQPNLTKPGKLIANFLKNQHMPHLILFGPPGCGKTQLVTYIAHHINKQVFFLNASFDKKSDIEKNILPNSIIFIDEIHNLNKKMQDYVMSILDSKNVTLIGATTQNPTHSINYALRSRTMQINFEKPNADVLLSVLDWHIDNQAQWSKTITFNLTSETKKLLIANSNNDARLMLLTLENALNSANIDENLDCYNLDFDDIKNVLSNEYISDANTDLMYDLISALQKSIRGSDVDAALYYLARLILNNELEMIIRRLSVILFEDIGFGNVQVIERSLLSLEHAKQVGLPQAQIILGFVVSEMALSPKDNSSYLAIKNAIDVNHQLGNLDVNVNVKYKSKSYQYPFENKQGFKQTYLPEQIKNENFLTIKSQSSLAKNYEKRRLYFKQLKSSYK